VEAGDLFHKGLRVPGAWIEGHGDYAGARRRRTRLPTHGLNRREGLLQVSGLKKADGERVRHTLDMRRSAHILRSFDLDGALRNGGVLARRFNIGADPPLGAVVPDFVDVVRLSHPFVRRIVKRNDIAMRRFGILEDPTMPDDFRQPF